MNTLHDDDTDADVLREAMIDELRALGAIRGDEVAWAFRAVPRHVFVPGELKPWNRTWWGRRVRAVGSSSISRSGELVS